MLVAYFFSIITLSGTLLVGPYPERISCEVDVIGLVSLGIETCQCSLINVPDSGYITPDNLIWLITHDKAR